MVPVQVEGVRRNFHTSSAFMYVVTLLDDTGRRMFTFAVERHEAIPIVAALHHLTLPRPPAIQFMAETLAFHGFALEELRLERFSTRPPLYHLLTATLCWRDAAGRATTQERTLRPGDAVGLALLLDSPITLADELADRIGIPLAEGQTPELMQIADLLRREGIALPAGAALRLGYSKTPLRDALVSEVKAAVLGKEPVFPEADLEQRKRALLARVLPNGFARNTAEPETPQ
jgi:bifunctional DNase/RNase